MTHAAYYARKRAYSLGGEKALEYFLGYNKRVFRLPEPRNPYDLFTDEHKDWQQGFDEATERFLKE